MVFFHSKQDKRVVLVLLVLVLAGFWLRFYELGFQSFWLDEAISTNAAIAWLEKGSPVFDSGFVYDQYVLNTGLIASSMAFFGNSEWAARMPSVFFGVFTIILAYFFGKEFGGKRVGLLAALFITFTMLEIAWSRQARMYQQLQFFYLLSILLFYKFLQNKKALYLAGFVASAVLAFLSHAFAYSLAIIYVIYLVYWLFYGSVGKDSAKFSRKQIFLLILLALGLLFFANFGGLANAFEPVNYFATYLGYLATEFWLFFWLGIAGFVVLLKRGLNKAFLLFLGFVIPFTVISRFILLLHFRYMYFLLPIIFVLAAIALVYLFDYLKRVTSARVSVAVAAIVLVLILAFSGTFAFVPQKEHFLEVFAPQPNFKAAYGFVEENMLEGDVVVDSWPAVAKYYLGESEYCVGDTNFLVDENHERYANAVVLKDVSSLEKLTYNNRVWLVVDDFAWEAELPLEVKEFVGEELVEKRFFAGSRQFWVRVFASQ